MRVKLDIPLSLSEVKNACLLKGSGNFPDRQITYICTDTRELCAGDLFVALRGNNFNGNDFSGFARSLGCSILGENIGISDITVSSTTDALLRLAAYYKSKLKSLRHNIGITGSCGKTTTKEFLRHICKGSLKLTANEGNFNNYVGLSLTILCAKADTEALICELGTNSPGEISMLTECLMPDIGIITNIGTSHVGAFGSREKIAEEKSCIAKYCNSLICDIDEALLCDIKNRVTVSSQNYNADVVVIPVRVNESTSVINIKMPSGKRHTLQCRINAPHLYNDLAMAIYAATLTGIDEDEIIMQISNLEPSLMRHRMIDLGTFKILDDSYNASLESISGALSQLSLFTSERSALLGDVLELGEQSEFLHFKIGEIAHRSGIRNLFLYGQFAQIIKKGALTSGMDEKNIFINTDLADIEKTAEQVIKNTRLGETLLFKASHRLNLGAIIEKIKEKIG